MATSRKGEKASGPGRLAESAQAVGRLSGSGSEYEVEKAQTKDGAGGGPAEERTCARGRGMRLLKIGHTGLGFESGVTLFLPNSSFDARIQIIPAQRQL